MARLSLLSTQGVLVLAGLALAACASSVPVHYYVLDAGGTAPAVRAPAASRVGSIGIRPTQIPDYLDRAEIVTRAPDNRLEVSDLDRWGEMLDVLVTRTLAEDLRRAMPGTEVLILPTDIRPGPRRLLTLVIDRFEAGPDNVVTLSGRWQLLDAQSNNPTAGTRVELREPIAHGGQGAPGKEAIAGAMSRALQQLAGQIAAAAR